MQLLHPILIPSVKLLTEIQFFLCFTINGSLIKVFNNSIPYHNLSYWKLFHKVTCYFQVEDIYIYALRCFHFTERNSLMGIIKWYHQLFVKLLYRIAIIKNFISFQMWMFIFGYFWFIWPMDFYKRNIFLNSRIQNSHKMFSRLVLTGQNLMSCQIWTLLFNNWKKQAVTRSECCKKETYDNKK